MKNGFKKLKFLQLILPAFLFLKFLTLIQLVTQLVVLRLKAPKKHSSKNILVVFLKSTNLIDDKALCKMSFHFLRNI